MICFEIYLTYQLRARKGVNAVQRYSIESTLKTPGSNPERVHWGQTPFRVNDDQDISQLDAENDPDLGLSDPIICQDCRKLTNFRVTFDSELSMTPMDPFPGHADPGVFIE